MQHGRSAPAATTNRLTAYWICLGPPSVTGNAILLLCSRLGNLLSDTAVSSHRFHADTETFQRLGDIAPAIGLFGALLAWGLSAFWFLSCLFLSVYEVLFAERGTYATQRGAHLWAFVFPNALFALLTALLANNTNLLFLRVTAAVLIVWTVLLWFAIAIDLTWAYLTGKMKIA
jgi:tellurite resistance protein TehA-like permease